jgi:hypothetical protein
VKVELRDSREVTVSRVFAGVHRFHYFTSEQWSGNAVAKSD